MPNSNCDVLIVGAGPAGLAAALELRRRGVTNVRVAEREPEVGGIPRLCDHTGFGMRDLRRVYSGPGYARRYAALAGKAGVALQTSTMATGWAGPLTLSFTSPRGVEQVTARAILLATGCRERPRAARLIPGSRPQGVFTTGSLQRFIHDYQQPIGRRAVIVGAELVSLSALMTLTKARTSVAMLITELPRHQIAWPFVPFKWLAADLPRRVPIVAGARVSRILGQRRVEAVEITLADSGRSEIVACDTVVFTGDWIPEHELARQGGIVLDPTTRGPLVDTTLRTMTQGVFAAGNLLRGAETADVAALEGRRAAQHIARYLEQETWNTAFLRFECQAPIVWIAPGAVLIDEHQLFGRFLFRVDRFCRNAHLTVRQDGRTIYRHRFRRLQPNQSASLRSDWLPTVDPNGGALQITID